MERPYRLCLRQRFGPYGIYCPEYEFRYRNRSISEYRLRSAAECCGCPRAIHVGDDDPWLRMHGLHIVSSEDKATINGCLIVIIGFSLRGRLRAAFSFGAAMSVTVKICGWRPHDGGAAHTRGQRTRVRRYGDFDIGGVGSRFADRRFGTRERG